MPSNAPNSRLPLAAAVLAVVLAATIPFAPAITAGIVDFDDPAIVVHPLGYRGLAADNLRWMFTTTHMGHYQPLTWLSYALEYTLADMDSGLKPEVFHTTNILLHAINASLFLLLARRLISAAVGDQRWSLGGATAAAILFALHPLRVESVAWITERRDVLSTAFLLGTVLAYLRAFPPGSTRPASLAWYAASIALLLISLICKAWGMTIFATLLVLDVYPLRRLTGLPHTWLRPASRLILIQKAPYIALGIAAAATAAHAQRSMVYTVLPLSEWGIPERLCQAAYGLVFYIHKLIAPVNLAYLYEVPLHQPMLIARFLIPPVLVAGGTAVIWMYRSRWPGLAAAAIIYAITLGPILGFMQSGPQLVADRYSYIANMSWAVLLGGLFAWWLPRAAPRARLGAAAAAVAITALLAALTWRQTTTWRSTEGLFRNAINAGADGPIARLNLARALTPQSRHAEAVEQLQRAVEFNPRYGEAWFSLGVSYRELGRIPDAEAAFKLAGANMADSWRADLLLARIYTNDVDQLENAERTLRSAIANVETMTAQNFSPVPYLRLAEVLYDKGDDAGARAMLLKAAAYPETREAAQNYLRQLDSPQPNNPS